jgi:signal transduction histidine kinase
VVWASTAVACLVLLIDDEADEIRLLGSHGVPEGYEAALEERQRLARELHDSVSHALYGIALGSKTAREEFDDNPAEVPALLDYVLSLAEAGMTEMRALIFELRHESPETEGVVATLEKQAATVEPERSVFVNECVLGTLPWHPSTATRPKSREFS